ncbi:site-specific DNA-methyltransferase [Aminipila terrae]|uniref:DNA methylase N-4/N-6 domain-containing protein n=1 Tax=Aminipila terrae TaxID=2697030 RepID=A0A6P1MF52_9FIRM|nr:site-specific DNA-methyltransferase [Aminipila terrae]QHI71224.1 hypothetical protein Ami3637_01380 [Aminipila terrae]
MKDVWQMDMVGRTSSERTGYATQKPEMLLERILKSCTKDGDLCADFFGGSGTLAAVAQKMGRNWITCDIGKNAVSGIKKRALQNQAHFTVLQENSMEENPGEVNLCIEKRDKSFHVILKGYSLKKEYLKTFGVKEEEAIRDIMSEDSLSLIDYWSVDFNYNGMAHQPQSVVVREKEMLEETVEDISSTGLISVCCVDVFGNVIYKTLKQAIQ